MVRLHRHRLRRRPVARRERQRRRAHRHLRAGTRGQRRRHRHIRRRFGPEHNRVRRIRTLRYGHFRRRHGHAAARTLAFRLIVRDGHRRRDHFTHAARRRRPRHRQRLLVVLIHGVVRGRQREHRLPRRFARLDRQRQLVHRRVVRPLRRRVVGRPNRDRHLRRRRERRPVQRPRHLHFRGARILGHRRRAHRQRQRPVSFHHRRRRIAGKRTLLVARAVGEAHLNPDRAANVRGQHRVGAAVRADTGLPAAAVHPHPLVVEAARQPVGVGDVAHPRRQLLTHLRRALDLRSARGAGVGGARQELHGDGRAYGKAAKPANVIRSRPKVVVGDGAGIEVTVIRIAQV